MRKVPTIMRPHLTDPRVSLWRWLACFALMIGLRSMAQSPPLNDSFANAIDWTDPSQSIYVNNTFATAEVGEPAHLGPVPRHSLWWTWTSPGHAVVTLNTMGSSFDTVLAVYTGDRVDALSAVPVVDHAGLPQNGGQITFTAVEGVQYRIAVDGRTGPAGPAGIAIIELRAIPFVPGAPRIDTQPQNQVVRVGGSATLSVSVSGSPPFTFQWWREGQAIPGATGSTLQLRALGLKDSGNYRVTVSNALGSVTSSDSVVRMTLGPVIAVPPASQTVAPGRAVRFTVNAGPVTLGYQWYKDGVPIPFATFATLDLPFVLPGDVGTYTVQLANFYGSEISSGAVLALTRPPSLEELAVRIARIQAPATSEEGKEVSFMVIAHGERPLSYQWWYGGQPIPGATNATYRIPSVRLDQAGVYSAAVTNAFGAARQDAPPLVVTKVPPPARPPNDDFANRLPLVGFPVGGQFSNSTATREPGEPLPVGGAGSRSIWWTWTAPAGGIVTVVAGIPDTATMLAIYQGESLDTLRLIGRTTANPPARVSFPTGMGESFQISVAEGYGIGGLASLTVNFAPNPQPDLAPGIIVQPQGTLTPAGTVLRLSVVATGAQRLTYSWQRDGILLPQFTGPTLEITNAQAEVSGSYSVTVQNPNGSITSNPAVVQVQPTVPTIQSLPESITLTMGYPLRLMATALGSEPLSYQWSRNGEPLPGELQRILSVTNVTPEHAGAYSVRVSNASGSTNFPAALVTVVPVDVQYRWTTLAGVPSQAGRADGVGAAARFNQPSGITQDANGNLMIADAGNGAIRIVSPEGEVSTLLNAFGAPVTFTFPVDVAFDSDGLLVVQERELRITRVHPNGLTGFIGGGTWGIGTGPDGIVYPMDRDRLFRIVPGRAQETLANRLSTAVDVVRDPLGNLLIADATANVIRKLAPDGSLSVLAGGLSTRGSNDGPALGARFVHPNSVSLDLQGNLFVADEFGGTIRRVGTNGIVSTVGGLASTRGSADGIGSAARFWNPRRVHAAPDGTLYVVDTENHTVRKGEPFAVPAGQPALRARQVDGQLELAWPATATGFVLEASDALQPNASWSPVSAGLTTVGDRMIYTEAYQAGPRFFRLSPR